MVTEEQLAEWERLTEAATEGPWDVMTREQWEEGFPFCADGTNPYTFPVDIDAPDAAFIAAAREAVPALVAEVRRLRALLEDAADEKWLERAKAYYGESVVAFLEQNPD